MICPTCHADRPELEPSGLCFTCTREVDAGRMQPVQRGAQIPGAPRSLYGTAPGLLFDVAEETAADRKALKKARKEQSRPVTVTESPLDEFAIVQTPSKPNQLPLF